MKHFIHFGFFLSIFFLTLINSNTLMAQEVLSNAPYESEWKDIDSLMQSGLLRSAKEALVNFRGQAKENNQFAHDTKALLYLTQVNAQLEEAGDWKVLREMEQELKEASDDQKPIFASLLAEMYHRYYQQHSWQLRNRTKTEQKPTGDETTWTISDFLQRTTDLYLMSLQSEGVKNILIVDYAPMVRAGKHKDGLYTVLYELLLDRAIKYFSNHSAFANEPAYESALDDIKLLSPAATFIEMTLPEKGRKVSTRKLLEVLQSGLAWKMAEYDSKENPAVIDFDLKRLKIVYEQLQDLDKEKIYEQQLSELLTEYEETSEGQEQMILLAQMDYLYDQGNRYHIDNESTKDLQWAWQQARRIGLEILSKYPESIEAKQAAFMQKQIETQHLNISIEAVQLPEQNGLISINYRNINKLHFRISPISLEEYQNTADEKETLAKILARPSLQQWSEELPFVGDFRAHRTESSFKGLPLGVYSLAVSHSSDFSIDEGNPMVFIHFWVSELGIFTQFYDPMNPKVLVVNRKSGRPVEDAVVNVWDLEGRRKLSGKQFNFKTDENGITKIEHKDRNSFRVEVLKGEDRLFSTDSHWIRSYYRSNDKPSPKQAYFFLDRGLYRPGQTLHFKTIVLSPDKENIPAIVANETFKISLLDANRQKVEEVEVTTNAFGSASGSFTLPNGGLLGQMSIQADLGKSNTQYFRVEEYKRPRFEAILDTLEGQIQLGDQVVVKGKALAFSGPAIGEAEVVYTVSRTFYFPWHQWRYSRPRASQTIAIGKTTTNLNGEFEFEFEALADASLKADDLPTYRYLVRVDVVDQSGETRSVEKTISIAKYPLRLEADIPKDNDRNEELVVKLSSANLEGKAVAVKGYVEVERLESPSNNWIKRYWPVPDQPLMNSALFKKRFPLYRYENESKLAQRPSLGMVWQKEVTIEGNYTERLDLKKWEVGQYKIRFWIRSEAGDTLEVVKFFEVNDWNAQQFVSGDFLKYKIESNQLEPGEKLKISLGSNEPQQFALTTISKGIKLIEQKWAETNGQDELTYDIKEKDRGGIYLNILSVRNNRISTEATRIEIPWSNKDLKISYETFRSKLYPGEKEEWVIKIDGPNKDQVAAEVLGSMYDASLDQISPFEWEFNVFPKTLNNAYLWSGINFRNLSVHAQIISDNNVSPVEIVYPTLWSGSDSPGNMMVKMNGRMEGRMMARSSAPPPPPSGIVDQAAVPAAYSIDGAGENSGNGSAIALASTKNETTPPTKIRTDLSETAFFIPQLRTDEEGRVALSFKAPEALTRWKLQLFAHDQDVAFALSEHSTITQKELMVLPNIPRFMREGDQIQLATKVSNQSDQQLTGNCRLELFDIQTNQSLNAQYGLVDSNLPFDVVEGQSIHLDWSIEVPLDATGVLGYRIIATTDDFSDGEEGALPILSNRVLLTESLPLFVRANKKKSFELKHLSASNQSIQHQAFTLEMTTNPAWVAIKALPYLQEYPYDCTEQLVNKYFANALASKLVKDIPKLRSVFDQWKGDANALKSPLMQNQDLKNALIEETPWVLEAQSEQEQRERIALLFDMDKMAAEQQASIAKLRTRQKGNGAFSWFPSGQDSWYITQYVVEQLTHLADLIGTEQTYKLSKDELAKSMRFCDGKAYDHWQDISKKGINEETNYLSPIVAHYLYVRSHYLDIVMDDRHREAYDFWWTEAEAHIMESSLQTQALITIAAQQSKRMKMAQRIIASLRERALRSDELGMYWKYSFGYYWHQLPVETHTLLMEAFAVMGAPIEEMEEMKIWLLRQKETNRWKTTKATAAAVYALMNRGNDWLSADGNVEVTFPEWETTDYSNQLEAAKQSAEAATGYYKIQWTAKEINPAMGIIKLKSRSKAPAWGGVYWRYFEDIDQANIFEEGPLKVERKIYKRNVTNQGTVLEKLSTAPVLGDRLTVRLSIRTDRDMEFVHLKDLRASGLEPIDQLSQYKYQGGLGYYQSGTDLATHFFFDRLPKGEYVLEYDLRVFHKGDFSNGLATLQCMYAPKFSSHSKGERLIVE